MQLSEALKNILSLKTVNETPQLIAVTQDNFAIIWPSRLLLWRKQLIHLIINSYKKIKLCQISTYQREQVSENNQAIFDNLERIGICSQHLRSDGTF
jgi:hypothetical protein